MGRQTITFVSDSPETTFDAGRFLGAGAGVGGGQIFLLEGDLGAGKTVLAKGLAAGLGIDPDSVVSPSFLIIREHAGIFAHVDLYKVADPEELFFTGFSDCLTRGMTMAIEWAQKLPLDELCGAPSLEIEISQGGGDSDRILTLSVPDGKDSQSTGLLARFAREIGIGGIGGARFAMGGADGGIGGAKAFSLPRNEGGTSCS